MRLMDSVDPPLETWAVGLERSGVVSILLGVMDGEDESAERISDLDVAPIAPLY